MKYIITPDAQLGKAILTPEEINDYIDQGYHYRERVYKITIEHSDYEVTCAEIWKKGDKEHTVIIPAFLAPLRKYKLEVYIFAVNLYSGDPDMSQRAAAEKTKEHFKLEKFSHTTIGRVMKKLSERLNESEAAVEVTAEGQEEKPEADKVVVEEERPKKRVMSVRDTQQRREAVKIFLKGKLDNGSHKRLTETCGQIAVWWYGRFNRLLL